MKFPFGILLILIGSCLMWVAVNGAETATPSGVYEALLDAAGGNRSRTESGTGGDETEERQNTGDEGDLSNLVGMEGGAG